MTEEQLRVYMTEPHSKPRFVTVEIRSWWNPLRYIIGKIYYKKA